MIQVFLREHLNEVNVDDKTTKGREFHKGIALIKKEYLNVKFMGILYAVCFKSTSIKAKVL